MTLPSDIKMPAAAAPPILVAGAIFPPESDPWIEFGLSRATDGRYLLPPGTIALQAPGEPLHEALIGLIKNFGAPPSIALWRGDLRQVLYRLAAAGAGAGRP
jgi:hypothetical protein